MSDLLKLQALSCCLQNNNKKTLSLATLEYATWGFGIP